LQAEDADAQQPLSLAALDLLAAKAVADVGIFVAPDGALAAAGDGAAISAAATAGRSSAGGDTAAGAAAAGAAAQQRGAAAHSGELVAADTASGAGIPGVAATSGPLPRGFEALYVALYNSPAGRSMSPAVRAARALALASSIGEGRTSSAQARAAAAWAVMPMVIPGGAPAMPAMLDAEGARSSAPASSTGGAPARTPGAGIESASGRASGPPHPIFVEGAPGAAAASASRAAGGPGQTPEFRVVASRAGESLRSFVAPYEEPRVATTGAASAPSARRDSSQGAVLRVPTAAQPLVQTGSPSSSPAAEMIRAARAKRASGDPGIPAWFEKAARQLFNDSSGGGGITLAEMTLVTSAPARHIAASPKTASSSAATAPQSAGGSEQADEVDSAEVQRLAEEVYAEICRLMAVATERNGEPWR
jgi:hypothetical protein